MDKAQKASDSENFRRSIVAARSSERVGQYSPRSVPVPGAVFSYAVALYTTRI
jgi:hypothetical protein